MSNIHIVGIGSAGNRIVYYLRENFGEIAKYSCVSKRDDSSKFTDIGFYPLTDNPLFEYTEYEDFEVPNILIDMFCLNTDLHIFIIKIGKGLPIHS